MSVECRATIGGVGLWSTVVVLPVIQAEFGVDRAGASIPYTATMIGFAIGGVLMGRLADRTGIMVPVMLGAVILGAGKLFRLDLAEIVIASNANMGGPTTAAAIDADDVSPFRNQSSSASTPPGRPPWPGRPTAAIFP